MWQEIVLHHTFFFVFFAEYPGGQPLCAGTLLIKKPMRVHLLLHGCGGYDNSLARIPFLLHGIIFFFLEFGSMGEESLDFVG